MWYVYILQCADDTLYTGITNHLQQRLDAHNAGNGAKYTRGRGPVRLLHCEAYETHSEALKREYAVKQFTRQQKLMLIASAKNGENTCISDQ